MQILVLSWATNRKDLEVVWKVLSQVCLWNSSSASRLKYEHMLLSGTLVRPGQKTLLFSCCSTISAMHQCAVSLQVCLAYRSDGGRVVVVLSERDKLEMEALFRRTIPEESRYGTKFVFRQVGACAQQHVPCWSDRQQLCICVNKLLFMSADTCIEQQ